MTMQKLTEAGLFGDSLVSVDTPIMIGRYNDGLRRLGIPPTELDSFRVDGIGWSPEIARERGDDYLLAGPANPMGVIVTPDQRGRPVYRPYTSYDRRLMDAFFEAAHRKIADLTDRVAIGLDFDQELSTFESAKDLEMVGQIIVRSEVSGLMEALEGQRGLITAIKTGDGWSHKKLRDELIASVNNHGDLRRRQFNLEDLVFKVRNFHTRAFGGVFVLRWRRKYILVLEDVEAANVTLEDGRYRLDDPDLLNVLLAGKLIELDLDWYREHLDVLDAKKDGLAVDAILTKNPEVKLTELTPQQWKRCLSEARDYVPTVYKQLERFQKQLQQGRMPEVERLSPELKLLLYRPRRSMTPAEQVPIWQLLIRLEPLDVYRLYTSDKNLFFGSYKTWPEEKQLWAIEVLKQTYLPEKKHHKTRRIVNND